MISEAERRDGEGRYVVGFGEDLPFPDTTFDLVVSYLSLIDIDDAGRAISEMARVAKPGGRLVIANLTSFSTSSTIAGRRTRQDTKEEIRPLGQYLTEQKQWFEWAGLRVQNWHRPLSRYMQWFLGAGLILEHFDEPRPKSGPPDRISAYEAMPYLMVMTWKKAAPPADR